MAFKNQPTPWGGNAPPAPAPVTETFKDGEVRSVPIPGTDYVQVQRWDAEFGVWDDIDTLKGAAASAADRGSSGPAPYHPQPYGQVAPDPQGAANLLMDYYDRQVQQGLMPMEVAIKQFDADLGAYNSNLQRAEQMNRDIRERQIAEASRQQNIQSEATSRAGIVARDIIPSMMPGNVASMNVPGFGNIQGSGVNIGEMFGQGLPTLAQQWATGAIPGQEAVATPGQITAPQLPQYNPVPLPNIQPWIDQTGKGTGPLGWA